jgi:hypothetical protein
VYLKGRALVRVRQTLGRIQGGAMIRYIIVSIGSGILFGVMDGMINGNPLA